MLTVVVKCANCGKRFEKVNRVDYGWRIDDSKFCTHTCMRAWERKKAKSPMEMRLRRNIEKELNAKGAVE